MVEPSSSHKPWLSVSYIPVAPKPPDPSRYYGSKNPDPLVSIGAGSLNVDGQPFGLTSLANQGPNQVRLGGYELYLEHYSLYLQALKKFRLEWFSLSALDPSKASSSAAKADPRPKVAVPRAERFEMPPQKDEVEVAPGVFKAPVNVAAVSLERPAPGSAAWPVAGELVGHTARSPVIEAKYPWLCVVFADAAKTKFMHYSCGSSYRCPDGSGVFPISALPPLAEKPQEMQVFYSRPSGKVPTELKDRVLRGSNKNLPPVPSKVPSTKTSKEEVRISSPMTKAAAPSKPATVRKSKPAKVSTLARQATYAEAAAKAAEAKIHLAQSLAKLNKLVSPASAPPSSVLQPSTQKKSLGVKPRVARRLAKRKATRAAKAAKDLPPPPPAK